MAEVLRRLGRIQPDARPGWGKLTPALMIRHLADAVRYSMGKGPEIPFAGNWLTRHIVAPLILNGVVRIPRNIAGANVSGTAGNVDLETLHAVLDEYLALVQAGELEPRPHPSFGPIGVDGWDKMHLRHFEHHLRQFGV